VGEFAGDVYDCLEQAGEIVGGGEDPADFNQSL
jgi:hypothetical protein